MKRRIMWDSVKAGAFVIGFVALLVFVLSYMGIVKIRERSGYPIYVRFERVKGLRRGTEVKMKGATVGYVGEIKFDYKEGIVRVKLVISKKVKVPRNATFTIYQPSLIGGNPELNINFPPQTSKSFLKPGEEAPNFGVVEPSVDELLAQAYRDLQILTDSLEKVLSEVEGILKEAKITVANLRSAAEPAVRKLQTTVDTVNATISSLQRRIDYITFNVQQLSESLKKTGKLNERKLAEILENLRETSENLKELSESAKELAKDEELRESIKNAVEHLENSSEELEKLLGPEGLGKTVKNANSITEKVNRGVEEASNLKLRGSLEVEARKKDSDAAIFSLQAFSGNVGFGFRVRGEEGESKVNAVATYSAGRLYLTASTESKSRCEAKFLITRQFFLWGRSDLRKDPSLEWGIGYDFGGFSLKLGKRRGDENAYVGGVEFYWGR